MTNHSSNKTIKDSFPAGIYKNQVLIIVRLIRSELHTIIEKQLAS